MTSEGEEIVVDTDFEDAEQLVTKTGEFGPDLICTHRGLKSDLAHYPYSLGAPIEEHVLDEGAQAGLDVVVHHEVAGVDDPQVQARLNGVVEEMARRPVGATKARDKRDNMMVLVMVIVVVMNFIERTQRERRKRPMSIAPKVFHQVYTKCDTRESK